ncbi:hypothetical protein ACLMJK_009425 [Lecanora helva]
MNPIPNTPEPSLQVASVAVANYTAFTPKSKVKLGSSNTSAIPEPKQTENVDNTRASLAREGMFFDDEDKVLETVMGQRASTLRTESSKKIQDYLTANATKDWQTFFNSMVPMFTKDGNMQDPTKKRDWEGEIVNQAKSFSDAGLDHRQNCQFVKGSLPLEGEKMSEVLVLATPQPGWAFGTKRPRFPDGSIPRPTADVQALVEVAPGMLNCHFAVENNGAGESIEVAENRALGAGTALVFAQRKLAIKAGYLTPKEDLHEEADTGIAHADAERIAFTCSWVPQMANIHVHWVETRIGGCNVYHMNLIRGYVISDISHRKDFRNDIHNVLEYGLLGNRNSPNRSDIGRYCTQAKHFKGGIKGGIRARDFGELRCTIVIINWHTKYWSSSRATGTSNTTHGVHPEQISHP